MQIQTPQLGKKSPALGKYELVVYVILIENRINIMNIFGWKRRY